MAMCEAEKEAEFKKITDKEKQTVLRFCYLMGRCSSFRFQHFHNYGRWDIPKDHGFRIIKKFEIVNNVKKFVCELQRFYPEYLSSFNSWRQSRTPSFIVTTNLLVEIFYKDFYIGDTVLSSSSNTMGCGQDYENCSDSINCSDITYTKLCWTGAERNFVQMVEEMKESFDVKVFVKGGNINIEGNDYNVAANNSLILPTINMFRRKWSDNCNTFNFNL